VPLIMLIDTLNPLRLYREAYSAVTDFSFFRTVFQQPLQRTAVFLLFLVVHTALVFTLAFNWYYLPDVREFLHWCQENFPYMEVQDGELSIRGQEPIVREYLGSEVYTFVFDATGEHEPLHKLSEPAVVFSKTELYLLMDGQTHTWPWSQLSPAVLGREELLAFEDLLDVAYFPAAFTAFFLIALLGKGFQVVLLTFFSMSASARYGVRLPYSHYLAIAAYSLTPAVAIDLMVAGLGQEVPYFSIIYLVTAGLYTYLATQRCVAIESK